MAPYYYYPGWWEGGPMLHFFINTAKWQKLPKNYRAILTAAAAKANVDRLEVLADFKRLIAPFDGIVTTRNTDIGALINAGNAGQELFEVSDLSRVRIYVQVLLD